MVYRLLLLCLTLLTVALETTHAAATNAQQSCAADIIQARSFFQRENELLRQRRHAGHLAAYNYNTNVTEANRLAMIDVSVVNAAAAKDLAIRIKRLGYDVIEDEQIQRQVTILAELGANVLPETDYKQLQNAISNMQTNYATTNVCSFTDANDCKLMLEPHIQERLSNSRDPAELAHYWKQWHDKAGTTMRGNFSQYVRLSDKAARLNNYASCADYWIHFYEDDKFERNLDAVYNAILPLYKQLHGYVRHRLREAYGDSVVSERGNIPMHLLGNMWAQQWDNTIDLYTPYPSKPFFDVTAELQRQKYSVRKMFELGDEFFQSLGMLPLPATFWNLSVLERPTNREIVCHASAWDLFQYGDVRIKMCTERDMHYLYVVHHELGHIQYYMQYADQATAYRDAPNPGFHEAVGDVIALSVSSPRHLQRIGLSQVGRLDEQSRINELFKKALQKIIFLPFAYTMDKYRYAVFRGDIDEENWNCGFWQMRSEFTGVEPPVSRTDDDFDPPAKYHIDADVEYLRYFAAHIFQFQFHKAMCTLAGQYKAGDPDLTLDNCDIFNSKEAGNAFAKMLSLGTSKHWKLALKEFTGDTTMDPSALLEYFEPLRIWLERENKRLGVHIGWGATDKVSSNCCPPFST